MRQECCGRVINTDFCPYCGTKADSAPSLLGYLKTELELAEQTSERVKCRLDPQGDFYSSRNIKSNQTALRTSEAKVSRLKGWIELVAKIDS